MGFGDKLKELREQAQQAVAENKDRIQDAVQVVGDVANTKTNGRYANKIAKVGTKVEQGVDKFADAAPPAEDSGAAATPAEDSGATAPAAEDSGAAAPTAQEQQARPANEPASGFPEFE